MADPAAVPLHDWTRVDAGDWHDFHFSWVAYLKRDLKRLLPDGYYARSEAVTRVEDDGEAMEPFAPRDPGRWEVDAVTFQRTEPVFPVGPPPAGVALAEAPGLLSLAEPPPLQRRRRVVIHHRSGDRVVALLELASPGNRDSVGKVGTFADKVVDALRAGVHVLLIDPFPPTGPAPAGLHGAVAERFGAAVEPDPARPLSFVGYKACPDARASVQTRAAGESPPRVPLFLDPGWFVFVDLAPSYAAATDDLADVTLRELAGGRSPGPPGGRPG